MRNSIRRPPVHQKATGPSEGHRSIRRPPVHQKGHRPRLVTYGIPNRGTANVVGAANAAPRTQHRDLQHRERSTATCSTETRSTERTPVKPAPFTYHRTRDVAETVALLAELGDEAKILAGGQSLVPMMNFRLARPSALAAVTRIPRPDYLPAGAAGLHVAPRAR